MTRDGGFARIAIVGAGRLGTVLGLALQEAGYPVAACASRTAASAARLAARLPACTAAESPTEAAAAADVVFLTVPDDAIPKVDAQIAWASRHLAIHCSGARPAAILESAAAAGAHVAGFHPLQTFADPDLGLANLPGSAIGIEADDDIWPRLADLAVQLQAIPLRITAEQRALYHAASVLVSNCTVGLMATSTSLWSSLGIERDQALTALLPLLEGTVRNLKGLGLPGALTGPVSRGNLGTVAAHLLALSEAPRALDVYRALSGWLIDLAQESGTISPVQASELRTLLDSVPATENRS